MRLIDADALENQFGVSDEDLLALDEIRHAPTVDAVPVVHGQWISKNPHGYAWTFVCSNCGYVDGYPFNDRHNYCPNCGAKMDIKDGDDNDGESVD